MKRKWRNQQQHFWEHRWKYKIVWGKNPLAIYLHKTFDNIQKIYYNKKQLLAKKLKDEILLNKPKTYKMHKIKVQYAYNMRK